MEHTKHKDKSWKQKQIKLKMKQDRENPVEVNSKSELKPKPKPKPPTKHIKPVLTFKQLSEMGVVRAKLVKNLIKYNEVPQWMRDVWSAEQPFVEPPPTQEPIINVPHEHSENCYHNE